MTTLTEEQAYAALFHFLEDFYFRTKSDDVGYLLGSMSLLPDGSTADPAVAGDWKKAVKFAIDGGRAGNMELIPLNKRS